MKRSEVDQSLTWNLKDLFETEEDYKKALDKLISDIEEFVQKYEGKLNSASVINECLDALKPIHIDSNVIENYVFLCYETDMGNSEALSQLGAFENRTAPVFSKLSFVDTEIVEQDKSVIEQAMKESEENRKFLERILEKKDHTLSKEMEGALAQLRSVLDAPSRIYSTSKMQDLSFDDITVDGKTYPMTFNTFEATYQVSPDTKFRRAAYKEFYEQLGKYENTFAGLYYANVQQDMIMSKIRNYDNIYEYLLEHQEVTVDMYNRQCDVIMEELAPHIRRYARLIKRINKLDKVTFADIKMPLDAEYKMSFTIDECREMVTKGLSVLGEEYVAYLNDAFDNRYIDYVDNEGKSSGAFCASPYGKHPYVLLTWGGGMYDVMTVAHELGHGGHFKLAGENQNILNYGCSTYFVESPSTTNELIMAQYLLEHAKSDREKRWIMSSIIADTYYHNFVTHFLEAYYQREVYRLVEKGEVFDAAILNKIFRETLEKFFGDDVEIEENVERTWMRQPHYYSGLYPYTYSAGLTIGTQMGLSILENPENAKKWIEVLKAGGSKKPVELAAMADVDITTDRPLKNTIAYIGSLIEAMEELTDKIEKEQ